MTMSVVRDNQKEERLDYNLVLEQLAINVYVMVAVGIKSSCVFNTMHKNKIQMD